MGEYCPDRATFTLFTTLTGQFASDISFFWVCSAHLGRELPGYLIINLGIFRPSWVNMTHPLLNSASAPTTSACLSSLAQFRTE